MAGMRTICKKTPDGKHFIVNGTKKWITGGMYADYFTVGCKSEKGFNVLLIERGKGLFSINYLKALKLAQLKLLTLPRLEQLL